MPDNPSGSLVSRSDHPTLSRVVIDTVIGDQSSMEQEEEMILAFLHVTGLSGNRSALRRTHTHDMLVSTTRSRHGWAFLEFRFTASSFSVNVPARSREFTLQRVRVESMNKLNFDIRVDEPEDYAPAA